MAKSFRQAGQYNLRGKKTKRLACPCCVVKDIRERTEKKYPFIDLIENQERLLALNLEYQDGFKPSTFGFAGQRATIAPLIHGYRTRDRT